MKELQIDETTPKKNRPVTSEFHKGTPVSKRKRKDSQPSLAIGEMQIKTTLCCDYMFTRMAKMKMTDSAKY